MLDPRFRFEDRRAMSRIELDREQYVAFCRQFGDMPSRWLDTELVATRGEHLFLSRLRLDVAGGDVGPSDLAYFYVHQTDDEGERFVAAVTFACTARPTQHGAGQRVRQAYVVFCATTRLLTSVSSTPKACSCRCTERCKACSRRFAVK